MRDNNFSFSFLLSPRCHTYNTNDFNTFTIEHDNVTTWQHTIKLQEKYTSTPFPPSFRLPANTIRVSTDRIRLSAGFLIASADTLIVFTLPLILLFWTPFSLLFHTLPLIETSIIVHSFSKKTVKFRTEKQQIISLLFKFWLLLHYDYEHRTNWQYPCKHCHDRFNVFRGEGRKSESTQSWVRR